MVRKVLLALGIVGPLFYVATDFLVATRWEGYSYTDQTVSELFAIGAPTRPLAVLLMLTYGMLAIAFGLGIWISAGEKRALRVVAVGLIGKEVLGSVATLFAPMHLREALAAGEGTATDTWHGEFSRLVVLSATCSPWGSGLRHSESGSASIRSRLC